MQFATLFWSPYLAPIDNPDLPTADFNAIGLKDFPFPRVGHETMLPVIELLNSGKNLCSFDRMLGQMIFLNGEGDLNMCDFGVGMGYAVLTQTLNFNYKQLKSDLEKFQKIFNHNEHRLIPLSRLTAIKVFMTMPFQFMNDCLQKGYSNPLLGQNGMNKLPDVGNPYAPNFNEADLHEMSSDTDSVADLEAYVYAGYYAIIGEILTPENVEHTIDSFKGGPFIDLVNQFMPTDDFALDAINFCGAL